MDTFNLDTFDPTTAQLELMASGYKWLTIAKDWEEIVKEAKIKLQKMRTNISKTLKADRDKAIKYQKDNIVKEKELIAIISPIEKELDTEIENKAMEEEMTKRRETLDIRRQELKAIWLENEYDEEYVLSMNFEQFMDFIRTEKARLFEVENEKKKAQEIAEKREIELKAAEEKGKTQAEEKAKQDIEREKSMREEDQIAKEEEQKKLESEEWYNAFKLANWYTEETKEQFYEKKEWTKIILFKRVAEFIIN